MKGVSTLSILQYNHESRDKLMASFLRDERIVKYDVIAIQEPWRNSFHNTTHNAVSIHFNLAYQDNLKLYPDLLLCQSDDTRHSLGGHSRLQTWAHSKLKLGTGKQEAILIHNVYTLVKHLDHGTSTIRNQDKSIFMNSTVRLLVIVMQEKFPVSRTNHGSRSLYWNVMR
jgi:hypothetical protein